MERELYKNDKSVIRSDDLMYDGKNIIIPSYWVDSLNDFLYLAKENAQGLSEGDLEEYMQLRNFLDDVQEYNNRGN